MLACVLAGGWPCKLQPPSRARPLSQAVQIAFGLLPAAPSTHSAKHGFCSGCLLCARGGRPGGDCRPDHHVCGAHSRRRCPQRPPGCCCLSRCLPSQRRGCAVSRGTKSIPMHWIRRSHLRWWCCQSQPPLPPPPAGRDQGPAAHPLSILPTCSAAATTERTGLIAPHGDKLVNLMLPEGGCLQAERCF